jgi:hypothetical protein
MDQIEIMRRSNDPAMQEYVAIVKQIEAGNPMHPQEVQDVIDALIEAGYPSQARMLAGMEVNWDRG